MKKSELKSLIREVITELQGNKGKWTIEDIEFLEFKKITKGKEGIVLLGAGGNLNEWIDGISKTFKKEKIAKTDDASTIFENAFKLETTGGRTDLALMFFDNTELNVGRMAMWRLKFGDCSWVSDYIVNYAKHHGIEEEPEENNDE